MTTLREAAQMALETLDNMVKVDWHEWDEFASVEDFVRWAKSRASFTAEALRAALAQPEQEPVAWRGSNWSLSPDNYVYRDYDDPFLNIKGENVGEPLYTAPPQREWQGLTDEEAKKTFEAHNCTISADLAGILYRAIEVKLKEKNG